MKGLKLAAATLVLVTLAFTPKAQAESLFNKLEIVKPQLTQPVPQSNDENTNDSQSYLQQGFDKLDKEDYEGAIADFNQVLKTEPNNVYAYLGRGVAYFDLHQYPAANTDFDQVLEMNPKIAYGYYFRGFTRYLLKDKPGAIADLRQASTLFKQQGKQDLAQKASDAVEKIQQS